MNAVAAVAEATTNWDDPGVASQFCSNLDLVIEMSDTDQGSLAVRADVDPIYIRNCRDGVLQQINGEYAAALAAELKLDGPEQLAKYFLNERERRAHWADHFGVPIEVNQPPADDPATDNGDGAAGDESENNEGGVEPEQLPFDEMYCLPFDDTHFDLRDPANQIAVVHHIDQLDQRPDPEFLAAVGLEEAGDDFLTLLRQGEGTITVSQLTMIANELGTDPLQLLTGEGLELPEPEIDEAVPVTSVSPAEERILAMALNGKSVSEHYLSTKDGRTAVKLSDDLVRELSQHSDLIQIVTMAQAIGKLWPTVTEAE